MDWYRSLMVITSIIAGFGVGLLSAIIFVKFNITIFGLNIMFIFSPIIAGFVETVTARRVYGESTGAVSALIIFIFVNIYGWFFPENPIVWNISTIGGLLLAFQAALPIFVNYVILIILGGIFNYLLGIFGKNIGMQIGTSPLRSPTPEEDFSEYIGIVTGEVVKSDNNINIETLKKIALDKMFKEAKAIGAIGVVNVEIGYVPLNGLKGPGIIITATGTAVK